jgi:hypothetical protein
MGHAPQPDDHGCADPLPPHAGRATRCGSRAPTMPASPLRWWWSANSMRRRHQRAMTWAARNSSRKSGNGKNTPAAPSRARCVGWAHRLDWDTRTLHDGRRAVGAVTEVFVGLYEEGLIYRGKRLVNWDPACSHRCVRPRGRRTRRRTAPVAYPLPAGRRQRPLAVATTRPETMLGDAAVAVAS